MHPSYYHRHTMVYAQNGRVSHPTRIHELLERLMSDLWLRRIGTRNCDGQVGEALKIRLFCPTTSQPCLSVLGVQDTSHTSDMCGSSRANCGSVRPHLDPNPPNRLLRLRPCQRGFTIHRMRLLL